MPSFCVVIPTLNAENDISALLDSILMQTIAPEEILVMDSSSTDLTQEIVAGYPNVHLHVIDRNDFDHGGTRHQAVEMTKSDFICFLTQDALPANDQYFAELLAPFQDDSVAMVSGRQIPKDDARPFERLVRSFNYPEGSFVRSQEDIPRLGIKAFFASDVCSAYRRIAYLEVGGFDYPLNTNEDMLIASRFLHAGWRIAYSSDATVLHSHNYTPLQQFKRNRSIGYFLGMHESTFGNLSEVGEGKKLVFEVSKGLIREHRYLELLAFGVDCASRLLGNRLGRCDAAKMVNRRKH